jgi:tetratricopeptide (TPR) repeat protein
LLEQAVARGCRRTETLLALARTQSLSGKNDEAIATLELIEDDPSDPAVAVERDHSMGNAKLFADSEWALPRLQDAGERWLELGNLAKHAWAKANAGVAFFYLSRVDESARELERALELFEGLGDRSGIIATTSFLCLAKPTDKRVPGWLADTLEFAEQAGDRTREIGALTTLVWHLFFVSFCGAPEQFVEAEASAARMTVLAEDLGAYDLAVHGWSLIAIMKRLGGELDGAQSAVENLDRINKSIKQSERWLGWAATFAVTVARGTWGVAPPFPPDWTSDPVSAMAGIIVESELALSGRSPEAVDRFQRAARPNLGPIGDLGGMMHSMALVLDGRGEEALEWVDRAARAASALEARPVVVATSALRAEITRQFDDLPDFPTNVKSLSDLLLLRAHAASGDARARRALPVACRKLAMPGVGLGLEATPDGAL